MTDVVSSNIEATESRRHVFHSPGRYLLRARAASLLPHAMGGHLQGYKVPRWDGKNRLPRTMHQKRREGLCMGAGPYDELLTNKKLHQGLIYLISSCIHVCCRGAVGR